MDELNQPELPLDDPRRPNPDAIRFERFHAAHPHYLPLLIKAVRRTVKRYGFAEIHHARTEVRMKHGRGPARDFLPAYARKIMSEHPELRGKIVTRPSKFGK